MSRRRRPREADNHDRWLVSYADFITLLFAFFATLYAISVVDVEKAERLVTSINESFGNQIPLGDGPSVLDGSSLHEGELQTQGDSPADRAESERSLDYLGDRFRAIEQEIDDQDGLRVRQTDEGLVISLAGSAVFASGSARLQRGGDEIVAEIAKLLADVPNTVRVEGHTDSRGDPARNWQLSSARAVTIVAGLEREGIDRRRLSAAGFADQRPLVSNRTTDGRRLNRRVDIVVVR